MSISSIRLGNLISKEWGKKMITPINKEEEKVKKKCINELNKIEIKFGTNIFKSACNRKLTVDRQRKTTEKEIKEAEKKLERLKSGKPLPTY